MVPFGFGDVRELVEAVRSTVGAGKREPPLIPGWRPPHALTVRNPQLPLLEAGVLAERAATR